MDINVKVWLFRREDNVHLLRNLRESYLKVHNKYEN